MLSMVRIAGRRGVVGSMGASNRLVAATTSSSYSKVCCYSSSSHVCAGYREPGYLVDASADVDAKEVKVPILSDNVKVEMYKRHKADPAEWTISKIAQHYGATLDRTKAVLFLMQKREEFMEKEKVLDIPVIWHEIYKRFSSPPDPAAATAASASAPGAVVAPESTAESKVAAADGAGADGADATEVGVAPSASKPIAANTKEALASEFGLSVSEVTDIIGRMDRHTRRQKNVDASGAYIDKVLENLANSGVDISFRETATAPKKGSIREDYYPTLFGDDGLEAAQKELLERIAAETKAEIIDFQPSLFGQGKSSLSAPVDVDGTTASATKSAVPINKAGVKTDHLSRWKIAFRDLSWRRTQPTMVRTRRGAWREANALEDAMRSWRKHPSQLDLETYRDEVRQFLDPDGDEKEAAGIRPKVLDARRQRKLAVAAAAGEKK